MMVNRNTFSLLLIIILLVLSLVTTFIGCGNGEIDVKEMDKFIGTWEGAYGCESIGVDPIEDTILIELGSSELSFKITLHTGALNPTYVDGNLTDSNTITIPEQEMGGAPGAAIITYDNGQLKLEVSGLGVTCEGVYVRQ